MSTERGVEMPQEYREAFQLAELIAIHLLVKSGNKHNEIENMVRRNVFEEPTLSHLGMLVNCTVFVGDSSCVCITIIFPIGLNGQSLAYMERISLCDPKNSMPFKNYNKRTANELLDALGDPDLYGLRIVLNKRWF